MNEMQAEELVREYVSARRDSVHVPPNFPSRILSTLTQSRLPSQRVGFGRELLAATAIILTTAVLAGGIAWLRMHRNISPAVTPEPTGQQGALTYPSDGPVRFVSSQVGWRVAGQTPDGMQRRVYRTSDGGRNWQGVLTIPNGSLTAGWSWFFDDRRAVVVNTFRPARIYRTIDGGASWQAAALPPANPGLALTAGYFISTTDGWVLMGGGRIGASFEALSLYQTRDGGLHWSEVSHSTWRQAPSDGLPMTSYITHLSFRDSSNGWIIGTKLELRADGGLSMSGPVIYLTRDGGHSWHAEELASAPGYNLADGQAEAPLFLPGDTEGFLPVLIGGLPLPPGSPPRSGYGRMVLYVTRDGGQSWSSPAVLPVLPPTDARISGGFLSDSYWWLAGGQEIWVTQDAGKIWAHLRPQLPEGGRFGDVSFIAPNHAYGVLVTGPATAALARASNLESIDGGASWHSVELPN